MPLSRLLVLCLSLLASPLLAQQGSLLQSGGVPLIQSASAALITSRAAPLIPPGQGGARVQSASLFAGGQDGFFSPAPIRAHRSRPVALPQPGPFASDADRIRHVIASAEASSKGYDSVQHGARVKPSKAPTDMTLGEIYAWIKATPRQPHAIGRYQFIPSTLRRLAKQAGFGPETRFTPQVQDALADILLEEAGLNKIRQGELSRKAFMNNLAKIWAGLPNSTGKSHYHGYAGNKASITWARFDKEMAAIFPS